jgi:hypothetical protein
MKRCPRCEFIYEDDQSLCDMDGVLLVLDSRTLPNHHALATVPGVPAGTQQRRNRAVPVFASLVLALVLAMVYYVSTRRNAPAPVSATTISTAAPADPAPPVQQPTPEQKPAVEPESKPTANKPAEKKSSTKTTGTSQPKPTPQAKKEDNKVGSILKKTGRILKKPFKF